MVRRILRDYMTTPGSCLAEWRFFIGFKEVNRMEKLRHDMLTHGVTIVTACHEETRGGLAVAWTTQVSTSQLLICVGKQSFTRELILASGAFGVNVLTREQLNIARFFGSRTSRTVDKFADIAYHTAETGSPLFDRCAVALDCQVDTVHDHGRRKLIIGKIVAAEQILKTFTPLVYRQEEYVQQN